MTQIECPTGHAVLPVPFTEAQRAPSLEEICEVQLWGREIEKIAVKMHPHFDFSEPKKFAASICKKGRRIFNDALSYLEECGVDTRNAVEMRYVLKSLDREYLKIRSIHLQKTVVLLQGIIGYTKRYFYEDSRAG